MKCQWYEKMTSQLNFFLILKNNWFIKALARKLEVNGKEICDHAKINDET